MAEEKKSRKPGGSAFKQQKLRACQPIITPKTIFPLFFIIAIIFTPLVYVKSLDTDQLKGNDLSLNHLEKGGCESMAQIDGIIIYPCGLIANSLFNAKYSPTKYNLTQIRPPPNWILRYPNGTYTSEFPPINPKDDEHFQVWMHAAGLPIFRKLYGKNETQGLEIVKGYEGTKALVISTISPIGGKNPFLGCAYIIVGCISGILGVLFTIKHFMHSKRLVKKRWKKKPIE
ncbi:2119_t:CDS:2 [Diversispora eburnea]|uniref:2119_t:CDS:1 n=1 Tax=Diversispora eburnea TaxID=1213867 RepID=A0A9N9B4J8_9GLOM|nr:2119_t:CDS:2 [Diversispora eburnea]